MSSQKNKPSMSRGERAEARKQRYIKITVALFMASIMVFSTVAYFFTPDPNSFTYNGIRFRAQVENGMILGYAAKIDGEQRVFFSRPTDSLTLPLPQSFIESMQSSMMVIVLFNPDDELVPLYDSFRFQLERSLGATPMLIPAVTVEDERYLFAVYSCDQATADAPVMFLTQGPLGIVADENNPYCVTLSGSQFEYALLHDRILYRYLGVTER